MEIDFAALADLGFSYFAMIIIFVGMAKTWSSVWPWFKDQYWQGRENRWSEQFKANQEHERMMSNHSAAFLAALEKFQNGFAQANADQHKLIIDELTSIRKEIEAYRVTNATLIEVLVNSLGVDEIP